VSSRLPIATDDVNPAVLEIAANKVLGLAPLEELPASRG